MTSLIETFLEQVIKHLRTPNSEHGRRRRSPYKPTREPRPGASAGSQGSLHGHGRPNTFRESLLTVLGKIVVWKGTRYTSTTHERPEIIRGIRSMREYFFSPVQFASWEISELDSFRTFASYGCNRFSGVSQSYMDLGQQLYKGCD